MNTQAPPILWTPSPERIARSNISAFIKLANKQYKAGLKDSDSLYAWSISEPEKFWTAVWDFCGVIAETRGERVLVDADRIDRKSVV